MSASDIATLHARLSDALAAFDAAKSWTREHQSGDAKQRLALQALANAACEVAGYARALRDAMGPEKGWDS